MKATRVFLAEAVLIAMLALAMPAAASDCPPDNPDCVLHPPQSIEVNPNPLTADGSPMEVQQPGALAPLEILAPMPAPPLLKPAPLTAPSQAAPQVDALPVPMRWQEESLPEGPAVGHVVDLAPLLDVYYEYRGWDKERGLPTAEKLKELGLEEYINEL